MSDIPWTTAVICSADEKGIYCRRIYSGDTLQVKVYGESRDDVTLKADMICRLFNDEYVKCNWLIIPETAPCVFAKPIRIVESKNSVGRLAAKLAVENGWMDYAITMQGHVTYEAE